VKRKQELTEIEVFKTIEKYKNFVKTSMIPFVTIDGLVKSQNLELLPQLVGIVKVVNTPHIVVTKISPDFLRNHQQLIRRKIIRSDVERLWF